MSQVETRTRPGITIRLDPATRDRVQAIADFERRSVASYVQLLIERDLQARDEAERVIHVFVAPELADAPLGVVGREDGESDENYSRRAAALDALFGSR